MNQPSADAGCLSEHLARAPWLRCGTDMFREALVVALPERGIGRKAAGCQHNAAADIDAAAQTGACVFHDGSRHRNAVISFSRNEVQEFFIDLKLRIQCPCSVQKRHHQCRRAVARHNGGSWNRLFDFGTDGIHYPANADFISQPLKSRQRFERQTFNSSRMPAVSR